MHFGRRSTGGRRGFAGLLVFAVASMIGVSVYAFTASNTVASHSAGAGSATVSGYTVTSPTNYTFSGDGTKMDSVTFDLDKAASDVAVASDRRPPEQRRLDRLRGLRRLLAVRGHLHVRDARPRR